MLQLQSDTGINLTNLTLHWQFSLNNGLFECDPQLIQLLGEDNKRLSLPQFFDAFERRRVAALKDSFKRVIEGQKNYTTSVLMHISDKRYLVNFSVDYSKLKEKKIVGEITFLHTFPSIDEEEELVKILFNHANNAILITDENHIIIKVNDQFLNNSGYQRIDLIGTQANVLKSGQYNTAFYKKLWRIVDTEKFWEGELLAKNKQGEIFAHKIKIQRIELSEKNHFYMSESKKLDFSTQFLADNPLDLRLSTNCLLTKPVFIKKNK